MARYLSIILFIAATIVSLPAQVRLPEPEVYVGTTHGATASMVMFAPAVNQSFLQGYNGGLVFRYIAEKNVGMQLELNYSQRGWKEANGLYARRLDYIEVPFMTHIYVGNKGRFFFNLGPKISYLISENTVINLIENPTQEQHITAIQNPFDYGLCAGLGYLFSIRKNIFQFDARANYSLGDVFSNDKRDYFDTSNNVNVSLNLAWLIRVK